MTAIIIGALLLVAGIVYMAGATLKRGRLSDPAPVHDPGDDGSDARAGTARSQISRPDNELAGIADAGGRRRAAAVGDDLDFRPPARNQPATAALPVRRAFARRVGVMCHA